MFIKPVKEELQYAAVLQHMEHLASTSPKAEIKGRALNVSRAMKEASFVAFCHFLADMFQILGKLSLHFQRNDLILPSTLSILKETIANIKCLAKRLISGGRMVALLKSFQNPSLTHKCFRGFSLNSPMLVDVLPESIIATQFKQALIKQFSCASKDSKTSLGHCFSSHHPLRNMLQSMKSSQI